MNDINEQLKHRIPLMIL